MATPAPDDTPRIMVRIGKGTRAGHVLIVWCDMQDADALLVWDKTTGEQFWTTMAGTPTVRATYDQQYTAVGDIELEIGGKVRVVKQAGHRGNGQQ